MNTSNTAQWEMKAMTLQLAQDVAEVKAMVMALAKAQTPMAETTTGHKRPADDDNEVDTHSDTQTEKKKKKKEKKKKKPRNASHWHVAVRCMQHYASQLAPGNRKHLMMYAKAHGVLQDAEFSAFLNKHVDRSKPQDNAFVDGTMIPAMANECKSMVRTLKALKPADVEKLTPTSGGDE